MKGRTNHKTFVKDGDLCLANTDDDFYYQQFESRAEFEEFIAELKAAADKIWPLERT